MVFIPMTACDFREPAIGQHGIGYKDSPFQRIIPQFMVHRGEFTEQDLSGMAGMEISKTSQIRYDVIEVSKCMLR